LAGCFWNLTFLLLIQIQVVLFVVVVLVFVGRDFECGEGFGEVGGADDVRGAGLGAETGGVHAGELEARAEAIEEGGGSSGLDGRSIRTGR
jgi:hypothetical protein